MKLHREIAGLSVKNNPIETYIYKSTDPLFSVLFLGGVHGNESEGYLFLERFINHVEEGTLTIPGKIDLWICPRINPDGCLYLRRTNANNVDLNRNLPTKDWTEEFSDPKYYPGPYPASEPETKTTLLLISRIKPKFIISFHSYEKPMINYNGDCYDLAKTMAEYNGLEPKSDIGYPTPGSLGTYAGIERNIPTITLEILRGQPEEDVWRQHIKSILAALEFYL